MTSQVRRVLILGGSGKVGQLIIPYLRDRFFVQNFDKVNSPDRSVPTVLGCASDTCLLEQVLPGHDALIYLLCSPDVADPEANTKTQVECLDATLETMRKVGVKRLIYASSMSVYQTRETYPLAEETPCDATTHYGQSKRAGELLCEDFGSQQGHTAIALRLYLPMGTLQWQRTVGSPLFRMHTESTDVARAFCSALECALLGFEVFNITGDWRGRHISQTKAHKILGWAPRARPNPVFQIVFKLERAARRLVSRVVMKLKRLCKGLWFRFFPQQ